MALPEGDSAGLIANDLGKETGDGFTPLRGDCMLALTETVVRAAIGKIKIRALDDVDWIRAFYMKRSKVTSIATETLPTQDRMH